MLRYFGPNDLQNLTYAMHSADLDDPLLETP